VVGATIGRIAAHAPQRIRRKGESRLGPLIVRVEDSESRGVAEHAFTRSPVRIGRSARNDLSLPQQFVSAWHGRIDFDDAGARYTDLGSTNGTLLNGAPVEARTAVPLQPGAEVLIGSLRFTFPAREQRDARAPAGAGRGPAPAPAPAPQPGLAPGGITALMKKLAAAPTADLDRAWKHVLAPGAVIGRFELLREVGRGSFGVVFEAKDRHLGRLVAFKAVRPGRESQVMFREELLQKEAEAVAQLNHPNIVSLFDAGTCDSGPYLIMELLRGENLRDRMRRGRIPLAETIEIAIEIAWALDHAHAAGVIHRDLKPANVFLCTGGHVKVLDFGIAHVFGVGSSRGVGTPAYMAPEQWRDAPQDARTDVFGAAATLAEMVTGRLPYRVTKDSSEVLERDARPHVSVPGAPPQLAALLRRGLAAEPAGRPKDGHAWLAGLLEVHELLDATPSMGVERQDHAPRRAAGAEPSRTPPPPARAPAKRAQPGRAERPARRTGALVLAAVAAATGLGALAYLLLS
jgi:hypothetical protein